MMADFTSKIIKGGALLEESRRFVELWNDERSPADNLADLRARNVLGKRSRKRTEDALSILRQRFVDPGPHVVRALRPLSLHAEPFRDACLFEAARNDALLAHAAGVTLFELDRRGWTRVTVEDMERALLDDPATASVAKWGDATRRRVTHGLLSALRDFGVLAGAGNKHLVPGQLSLPGFVYAAGRLRQQGGSSQQIATSPVWRWWLLEERQVRALLLEADREGVLRFSDAGSTVRIDWLVDGLEEVVRAIA
jgi:hypothetical protein